MTPCYVARQLKIKTMIQYRSEEKKKKLLETF